MNMSHMTVFWVPGSVGGWTVQCPRCSSLQVRKTWPIAMAAAHRHVKIHQNGPFA